MYSKFCKPFHGSIKIKLHCFFPPTNIDDPVNQYRPQACTLFLHFYANPFCTQTGALSALYSSSRNPITWLCTYMWSGFDPMCTQMQISNMCRCWGYQWYEQVESHSLLQRQPVIWKRKKKEERKSSMCDAYSFWEGCGGWGRDLFTDSPWNVSGHNLRKPT